MVHFGGTTLFSAGRIPTWVIKKYCTRKAYIYLLEVAAQFMGLLLCRSVQSTMVISFIDNTSGFFALRKGYCKHDSNGMEGVIATKGGIFISNGSRRTSTSVTRSPDSPSQRCMRLTPHGQTCIAQRLTLTTHTAQPCTMCSLWNPSAANISHWRGG